MFFIGEKMFKFLLQDKYLREVLDEDKEFDEDFYIDWEVEK